MTELYKLLDYSYMMKHKNKERERLLQSGELQEKKIAVLCGSTLGEIKEFLEIFLLYYGIKPVFYIGEYNRFYEEAAFPNEELDKFHPDIVLVHVTNRNLLWEHDFHALEDDKRRLREIWNVLGEKYHCIIIQNNFEYFKYRMIGNAARTYEDGNLKYIDDLNRFISDCSSENKNLFVNDINFLSSYTGLRKWSDERLWNMYKYPMAMDEMPRYALSIANIIKSVYGKNKKTIITDLDNTLWGGEVGEVGVENIKLGNETPQGEAFSELHRYLKYLTLHGIVLNICSKNEYDIGISGVNCAKSVLKEKDFAIKKINWRNKADNIEDILKELSLLSSSAVFIDDSLVECDSVGAMIPDIETIQAADTKDLLNEIDALSFFEVTQITQEDGQRSRYYADNVERNKEQNKYKNYDEYLNALKMVCHIDTIRNENIDRVVQLMNKTNQFNFLTKRYTLETMNAHINRLGIKTFVLDLEDKFGSNGIVSVAIVRFENKAAHIDDWIMSCRVFERGLEYVMLTLICETCMENGVDTLYGYYNRTEKNMKIAGFFQNIGFEEVDNDTNDNKITKWICNDINGLLKKSENNNIVVRNIGK